MYIHYENYKGGINNLIVVESCGIITTGLRSKEAVIKSHKRKLNVKLTSLDKKRKRLEDKLDKQQYEENKKIHNIGWGAAARGYNCMRRVYHSFKTKDTIKEVVQSINEIKTELEFI